MMEVYVDVFFISRKTLYSGSKIDKRSSTNAYIVFRAPMQGETGF